jgi:Holliday junction resolvase
MSKSKGDRYERRLVNFFDAAGYMVMRAPSSGSATERDLPDVFVGKSGERVAFEVKYEGSTDGIVYLTREEVEALCRFATVFGADPMVAVRWYRDGAFYLFGVDQLDETNGGNLRVTREMCGAARTTLVDPEVKRGHGVTPTAVEKIGVTG